MVSMCHLKCVGPYGVHVSPKLCGPMWCPRVTYNVLVPMVSMCHLKCLGPYASTEEIHFKINDKMMENQ